MSSNSLQKRLLFILPAVAVLCAASLAFRDPGSSNLPMDVAALLQLPSGWPMPPTPADNPITREKFILGRQLFYEVKLSGDGMTSCATCHNPRLIFSAGGSHSGAFGVSGKPARMVPRLANVAYDTTLTWDGHIRTLEEQVHIAVLKKGDLESDTTKAFAALKSDFQYQILFGQAFGDSKITLDRVAKAIATFERCLISANSPYDQYLSGDSTALSASAARGMKLFFDTNRTNCAFCHNSLGNTNPNAPGQTFTDNNYYRTGVFEDPFRGNGGYGFDTNRNQDPGRAMVTKDSQDLGKFRTPSLRNLALTPPFGADGFVFQLSEVIAKYNHGGSDLINDSTALPLANQDKRVKPLHLDSTQLEDLSAFLTSLTDLSFISNPMYQDSTFSSFGFGSVDEHLVSGDLSVYPDPVHDDLNIRCLALTGAVHARLISMRGVVIWSGTVSSDGRMHYDVSTVPNGMYRLELQGRNGYRSCNVIVAK